MTQEKREEFAMRSMSAVIVFTMCLGACGAWNTVRDDVLPTVVDAGRAACMVFGQSHPGELKQMAEQSGANGELTGLDIQELCRIQKIVQPFVNQLLGSNESMAGAIRGAASE